MSPNVRDALAWLRANHFTCAKETCLMCNPLVDSLKARNRMSAWLAKHATITLDIRPEQEQIRGNCSAIDPVTDRETEEWIERELDARERAVTADDDTDPDELFEQETALDSIAEKCRAWLARATPDVTDDAATDRE